MSREIEFPLTAEMERNLDVLVKAVNVVREAYGQPMFVSSGYRPGRYNKAAGGANHSAHLTCEACDFRDHDHKLKTFVLSHLPVLEAAGLFLEDPRFTPGWIHLQTRKPPSGNRIFIPR